MSGPQFYPAKPPRTQPQPGHVYDVAVIGAGLAGTELAWRLARAGLDVLLVSQALDHLGNLYQPTIEGVNFPPGSVFALVRERIAPQVDGGGDGPLDGWAFHRHLKAEIEGTEGLHLLQSTVTGVDEEGSEVTANEVILSTWEGPKLRARRAVLAVGAFLKGRLLLGETVEEAGRLSEVAYDFLADDLSRAVLLVGEEQEAPAAEGAPPYSVRFLTPARHELRGFRLGRFDHVYALGRCTPGEHTYASVLNDAAALALELAGTGLSENEPGGGA